MNRIMKVTAFVLALAVIIGLVGCGTHTDSGNSAQSSAAGSSASSSSSSGKEIALKAEKPVLKVLLQNTSLDTAKSIEARDIVEATGYKSEYSSLPAQNATEALMLDVSSGAKYDIIITKPGEFYTLMNSGALTPLNDYIDAIAPELWNGVSKAAWAGVSGDDGKVYGLPNGYPYDTEVATFIVSRMDLLEKAGITTLPTTLDEFTSMLYALKKYYGDKYTILTGPYNRGGAGTAFNIPLCISSAFGIYNDWMVDKNGKVIYMTEHENFQKMMDYFAQLYKDGIIDTDYAINTLKSVDEKLSSGNAILTIHNRDALAASLATLEKDSGVPLNKIGWIGALTGADGTCTVMNTDQYQFVSVVPKTSDNAADVINFFSKYVANQEFLVIGKEGVHFQYDEGKTPVPIQPAFNDERNSAQVLMGFLDMEKYKNQWLARVHKSEQQWAVFNEVTIKANKERPDIFVDAFFAYTGNPVYQENNTVLRTNLNDYMLQLIMGTKTVGDSLSGYMSDWKANSGEEVRKGLQEFYDKNFKK